LPPVEIGVTARAALPDVRKYLLYVAARALDVLVQAAKRIASVAVVVKLDALPQRLPGCGRMAGRTCLLDGSMRISRFAARRRLPQAIACHDEHRR
jgi:hypothetical protein